MVQNAVQDTMVRSSADLRLVPRVAARLPIRVWLQGQHSPFGLVTCDVGIGGACLEAPFAMDPLSVRRAVLDLPEASLGCHATGRWCRRSTTRQVFLCGVEFLDLSSADRFRLWDFVNRRATELALFLKDATAVPFDSPEQAMDVALCTRVDEVPARTFILQQGSETIRDGSVFIVRSGTVELDAVTRGTRVAAGRVGVGGLFGGWSSLAGLPSVVGARAADDCVLLQVEPYTLEFLKQARPQAAEAITRAVLRGHAEMIGLLVERVTRSLEREAAALRSPGSSR